MNFPHSCASLHRYSIGRELKIIERSYSRLFYRFKFEIKKGDSIKYRSWVQFSHAIDYRYNQPIYHLISVIIYESMFLNLWRVPILHLTRNCDGKFFDSKVSQAAYSFILVLDDLMINNHFSLLLAKTGVHNGSHWCWKRSTPMYTGVIQAPIKGASSCRISRGNYN